MTKTMLTQNDDSLYKSEKVILITIIGVAAILRFTGINFGLPYIYNYDESSFVTPAYNILANLDPNPHWFGHPGSFLIYLLAIVGGIVLFLQFLLSIMLGDSESFSQFVETTRNDYTFTPSTFHFIGRIMIVIMAIIGIYFTYKVAKRVFNREVGLISAFILAMAPLHVKHSHFFRTDISSSLFILLAIYLAIKYLDNQERIRYLFWAAFFGGISVANKYTSGVVIVPLFIVSIIADFEKLTLKDFILKSLLCKTKTMGVLLLFFLGFFAFAPFVILDLKNALIGMKVEARAYHLGATGQPGIKNYAWYITDALNNGIGGLVIELMAGMGIIILLKKLNLKTIVLFSFPVIYFLAVGLSHLRWDRWMIVVLPFEAILAGISTDYIIKNWLSRGRILVVKLSGFVIILALLVNFAYAGVANYRICMTFTTKDSRTISKEWIEDNIPHGASIAYERYCPHLHINNVNNYRLLNTEWEMVTSNSFQYYKDNGYEFIVLTEGNRRGFASEKNRYSARMNVYQDIERESELLKTFTAENSAGPEIRIYKIK